MSAAVEESTPQVTHRPTLVKISANLPEELVDALKRLAGKRNTTVTEVLRDAIANEIYLDDQVSGGAKLLLEPKEGERLRELVFR